MATLYTPRALTGVIGSTPSGTVYSVKPGQTISVIDSDVPFLLNLGFAVAAVTSGNSFITVTDGTTTVPSINTIDFTSGATVSAAGGGVGNVAIGAGGIGTLTAGSGISIANPNGPNATITNTGASGTVTQVIAAAGPFLNATTITGAGTITGVASLAAHGVILGEGTNAVVATAAMTNGQLLFGVTGADPAPRTVSGDITFNSGGTSALGSIVAGGTFGASTIIPVITVDTKGRITNATTVGIGGTSADHGAVSNNGTIQTDLMVTLTGTNAGTTTIAPGTGTTWVVLNMPTTAGTVTVAAAPAFSGQRSILDIKFGATISTPSLNSGFVQTGGVTYTPGTVANAIDRLEIGSPDGTHFVILAIQPGATL